MILKGSVNPQTLLIIAKELRQECNYVVSPVIKKRLRGWAERLEAEAKQVAKLRDEIATLRTYIVTHRPEWPEHRDEALADKSTKGLTVEDIRKRLEIE